MKELNRRTANFTDSVIRRMTRIAQQYGAINLSQGFPDFDPPKEILEALRKTADHGPHQYALTWGAKNFREALAEKQSRFMGIDIDPETQIVVTCGSTEAMMAAMMTVINPGDKVIVFSPFYENYTADTVLSGAEPIFVSLTPPEYNFDVTELEDAFKQNPKALILCNPANPSGKVFSKEELQIIANFAEEYDTYVITDEVYEHLVYAPKKHEYIAALPGMAKRTICCSSLSKTYHITGWRIGYIIGPPEIIEVARQVHDFLTVGAAAPLQEAIITGLKFGQDYYDAFLDSYTVKRNLFLKGLDDIGLKYTTPEGAYYVMVDVKEFNVKDDVEFCEWVTREVGVAAVPGSSFFRENINDYIRFHFAKREDTLTDAIQRLSTIYDKFEKTRG